MQAREGGSYLSVSSVKAEVAQEYVNSMDAKQDKMCACSVDYKQILYSMLDAAEPTVERVYSLSNDR